MASDTQENNVEELDYDIAKWKEVGILEGIPEERHGNAVKALNTALNYILIGSDIDKTWAMQVIRKILVEFELNKEEVIEIIKEFEASKFPELDDCFPMNIDYDCEKVCIYCDWKLEQLRNKNNYGNLGL